MSWSFAGWHSWQLNSDEHVDDVCLWSVCHRHAGHLLWAEVWMGLV